MANWQVVDASTSIGLPSGRKVVATFDNIKEATLFAEQTAEFKIRPQPMKRRKKDDPDDE
jgi:hypothetical protein